MKIEEITKNDISSLPKPADMTPQEQLDFLKEATERIMTRVSKRIEAMLPEAEQTMFYKLFDGVATEGERVQFLTAHVPRFEDYFFEETLKFKQEALEEIEKNKIGQE